MKKTTAIILTCCLVFGTTLVATLYALNGKIVHEHNSFLRNYPKAVAMKSNEIDIDFNSYYIAGITRDRIYLGNISAPFRMLTTNLTLTDTQHVKLNIKTMKLPTVHAGSRVVIDEPYFYIADGMKPAIYRGKLGEWNAEPFMADSAFFNQLVPISNSSFSIRSNNKVTLDNMLGKVNPEMQTGKFNTDLLEKQGEGIFSTDGMMQYNKDLHKLVYTYYYRNGYVVYDTALNLEFRGHTIDTFRRAQIKVAHITSENANQLTYKKHVNLRSSTSANYLFIQSELLAKNDLKNMLSTMSIIDVYDLRDNTYAFSFSVGNLDAKTHMRDFRVIDNRLVGLFDHYMVTYDLQKTYFKQ